ncbi:RNA-directed DNA polymerase, eukaryota, reverse transcriptase zinc-binding domain protein [Tanacetum coccineum]
MYNLASWNIRGMNQAPKQKELRQVIFENNLFLCAILESHVADLKIQDLCSKVFKRWNWTSNVMHICVLFKADQKEALVFMGDFNVSLHMDDKSTGTSTIDTGMRDFQACVKEIEVSDVNSTGIKFMWNQNPHGVDGVLKKIDRIMANMEFSMFFVGANAIFQPYRISDHAPVVLHFPMLSTTKPRPYKFYNIVVHIVRFKDINVKKLRHELDEAQKALDGDPSNIELREKETAYLQAFNDAILVEERFLMQKAKIEWLKLGDANTAYFHKVVKT